MSLKDVMKDFEGYQEIKDDIAVLKKYGIDHTWKRGQVEKILEVLHPKKLYLKVSEVLAETATTKTFRLVPRQQGWLPPFQAGQYINLVVEAGGIVTSRDYSISSSPTETAFYDITIRQVEDGFVSDFLLGSGKVGDEFESSSPAGNFVYNPLFHGNDLVFLAGGSGITPFMSMIREAAGKAFERRIHLFYGSRSVDDVIFEQEIETICTRHPNITWTKVISDPPQGYKGPTGFITADLMKGVLGGLSDRMFYLCGPEAMYTFCQKELSGMGIPRRKVRIEMYGPPKDVTMQAGWPAGMGTDSVVTVKMQGGRSIQVRTTEPLMNSLERGGIVIPALCRSGECSLCRTKLLSGKVFQPEGARIRKSDRMFGYIHPCLAYPLTDVEILIP
jgi:glycine betaine catabolism B